MMNKTSQKASNAGEALDDLFDYSKTLPPVILLDDDEEEEERIALLTNDSERPLNIKMSEVNSGLVIDLEQGEEANKAVNDNEWLEPPPTLRRQRVAVDDPTLLKLRQQKQVLQEIFLTSKASVINSELNARLPPLALPSVSQDGSGGGSGEDPCSQRVNSGEKPSKRQKILLKLQDPSGEEHGFKANVDDKLEKVFALYAKTVAKRPLTDLVFRFDGDKIDPNNCPQSLQLEDEDVLEVHVKGGGK